jgi:hypothetical protein
MALAMYRCHLPPAAVSLSPNNICCVMPCCAMLCPQDALCQAAVSAGIPAKVVYGDMNSHELPRLIYYAYVSVVGRV